MAWDVDVRVFARKPYTGREAEPGARVRYPTEEPSEGCPAGWRRTAYVASVAPYLRMRVDGGARVPNPMLDRCDDPAIHAAVALFEREQERCIEQTEASEAAERVRQLERMMEEQQHGRPAQGNRHPRR